MTRSQRPVWLGEDARGWDHARIHRQLLQDPRVEVYELGTYVGLAIHAETMTGDAEPAAETLARYLGCSERRVRTALDALGAAGYIEETPRPGKASRYRLLPPPPLPPTPAPGAGVPDPTPERGAGVPRNVAPATPDPGADEQEPVNENQGTRDGLPAVVASSPHLDDARRLCRLLADSLEARGEVGASRKATTRGWLLPMEAMLRIDGRPADKAEEVIRWLDAGRSDVAAFWRGNVRSPEKLRARWAQMEEQVQRRRAGGGGSRSEVLVGPGALPLADAVRHAAGVGGQGPNGTLRSGAIPAAAQELPR